MAGEFDLTSQYEFSAQGIQAVVGEATLADNAAIVTTSLSQVVAAWFEYVEAPGAATQKYVTLSTTSVTFNDTAVAAKKFRYVILGMP